MKFTIIINTCNRREMLEKLLDQIEQEKDHEVEVLIFNDGEHYNLDRYYFYNCPHKFGRHNYYALMMIGWTIAHSCDSNFYINLPDDIELKDDFFNNALKCWISSTDCAILDLMKDQRDRGILEEYDITNLVKSQELCIMYDRSTLEWLYYLQLQKPKTVHSSGVAKQINEFAKRDAKRIFQVKESLVTHGDHHSQMNTIRKYKIIAE